MWLCIDQGGHSTRAVVYDGQLEVLAQAAAPVTTVREPPFRVEHDAGALLASVERCIDEVARELGSDVSALHAVGIATQRSTLTCASRSSGDALVPLISWQDRRGQEDLLQFEAHADTIKRLTGLRLSPHYGVGKLRWCLQHVEAVREHFERDDLLFAPLATYVVHALCRERPWSIDPVNASRTLLMDMHSAAWSQTLTTLFDVPQAVLPSIRPCRSTYGTIDVGRHAVPLTVLTGDQSAAVYALGEPAEGTAFVNIGTGAFIQAMTGSIPIEDAGLLSSVVWQDGIETRYVLEGTINGAASAVDAMAEELGMRVEPSSPELARAFEAIEAAPLFLNGIAGLGSPDWRADFQSRFIGGGSSAERLAAVYESIAFLIIRNLDRMARRIPLTTLTVSGGLARLDWLVQSIANLARVRVSRPADTEATLAGLAYLVSGGRIVNRSAATTFAPRPNKVAERRYRAWTAELESALAC